VKNDPRDSHIVFQDFSCSLETTYQGFFSNVLSLQVKLNETPFTSCHTVLVPAEE